MKVTILGGGTWGTALAQVLSDNEHEVYIYDINEKFINVLNEKHIHPLFGDNVPISKSVTGTTNLKEAMDFSDTYLTCVPTKFMRTLLKEVNQLLDKSVYIINASKGIEPDTLKRISEIVAEEIDENKLNSFTTITGPSHAEEVIERKLTTLTAVCEKQSGAEYVQKLFNNSSYIRVYSSTDVIGAEVGGSVKNAIALISGVCTGLGFGENARAALIARGMKEMIQLIEVMGGDPMTGYGLTGLGDLIVTASSTLSRNFTAGVKIGKGTPIEEIMNGGETVEGLRSLGAVRQISKKHNLYTPIITVAHKVMMGEMDVNDAIPTLLANKLKTEAE